MKEEVKASESERQKQFAHDKVKATRFSLHTRQMRFKVL